jgi:transketolase
MALTRPQKRILELSYRHGLTHIGSCISIVGILDHVYSFRKPSEPVCLGAGHAGLALYVVLEKYLGIDPEMMLAKHGIHATRDEANGVYVSSGSLGQVETVAAGLALAHPNRRVWLISSDGGMAEGSCWETLMFSARGKIPNLNWFVNANGYGAYREVDVDQLEKAIHVWNDKVDVWHTDFAEIPFLSGLNAHYCKMTDADWAWVQDQEVV